MPVTADLPLYLIVPAHNEEKNIAGLLESYTTFFTNTSCHFHVIVNNSTDQTVKIAENLAEQDKRIFITNIDEAIGKGGAIIAGFRAVADPITFVGFVDADGAISPTEYAKLLEKLADDPACGMAIASRWVRGAKFLKKQSLARQFSSRAFNFVVRLLFGFSYHDTQCGAKVMTHQAFTKITPGLQERSFAFDIELLWQAKKHNIKVAEVPIDWQDQPGSSVVLSRNLQPVLSALWRIRWQD